MAWFPTGLMGKHRRVSCNVTGDWTGTGRSCFAGSSSGKQVLATRSPGQWQLLPRQQGQNLLHERGGDVLQSLRIMGRKPLPVLVPHAQRIGRQCHIDMQQDVFRGLASRFDREFTIETKIISDLRSRRRTGETNRFQVSNPFWRHHGQNHRNMPAANSVRGIVQQFVHDDLHGGRERAKADQRPNLGGLACTLGGIWSGHSVTCSLRLTSNVAPVFHLDILVDHHGHSRAIHPVSTSPFWT